MYIEPDCVDLHTAHNLSTNTQSGITSHETAKLSMYYTCMTYFQYFRINMIIVQSVMVYFPFTSEHF